MVVTRGSKNAAKASAEADTQSASNPVLKKKVAAKGSSSSSKITKTASKKITKKDKKEVLSVKTIKNKLSAVVAEPPVSLVQPAVSSVSETKEIFESQPPTNFSVFPVIRIDHSLDSEYPNKLKMDVNKTKPKRGSFEIFFVANNKEVQIWSGISKGPPRKLKFPDTSIIVSSVAKLLDEFSTTGPN
ncbi:hypothetical protein BB561_001097 [Smittium simulii]|uniref:Selenoprotein H n=1 Tax=Smittium simulii TaxID=133385 RepID=A0A2T9YW51_9FUNG|nr:hypothetical protein BB561_001097 [Smittium simulii]